TEPLRVRAHPPGALLRRALLRHGSARPPARPARMARRPTRVESLGHPPATLLLPLRRRRRGIRTAPTRGTRHAAAAGRVSASARRRTTITATTALSATRM